MSARVGVKSGSGACLAPLVARLFGAAMSFELSRLRRLRDYGPGVLALASAAYGVVKIAPRTYPVAYAEYHQGTAPIRAARDRHLKRALVLIFPEDAVQGWCNLNQNAPFDPNPDILFLARLRPADEACARRHFPGLTWYQAHANGSVERLDAGRR
jgi:hypothetical protein